MTSSNHKWQDCENGVIDKMMSDQQQEQTRATRRRALGVMVVGAAGCVGTVAYFNSNNSEPASAQMACEHVHKRLQAFVDNDISDLYVRGMVSRHIFVCAACQKVYQGMIDGNDFLCDAEEKPA